MLNVFPILFLSLFAHTIIRVITGLTLCFLSISQYKQLDTKARVPVWGLCIVGTEFLLGIGLLIGFLTQIVALALFLFALLNLLPLKKKLFPGTSPAVYVLLIGISLSLVITGAGAFAIDIPF